MKESSQASKSASAASHHHLHAPFALSLGDVELELFQSSELQLRYLPDLTLQYNTCTRARTVHVHYQNHNIQHQLYLPFLTYSNTYLQVIPPT